VHLRHLQYAQWFFKKQGDIVKTIPVEYWRAPLAEASLPSPKIPDESKPIRFEKSGDEWVVCEASPDLKTWIDIQFKESPSAKTDKKLNEIPFLLVPVRLSGPVRHGLRQEAKSVFEGQPALCIPCLLNRQARLSPDPNRQPWIPRDLLEPSLSRQTIGELERQDQYFGALPQKATNFGDVLDVASALFVSVTGISLSATNFSSAKSLLKVQELELVLECHGSAYDPPIVAVNLVTLYDQICAAKPAIPLFDNLRTTTDRASRPPLDLEQSEQWYAAHWGHINRKHPLSPSQREAMVEFAQLSDGEVLAVNGPPGTGKTTLLQSVIAQIWIKAALQKQTECPLILITSTNVKAVENVLESFVKISAETGHKRWHDYDRGFGLFLPSESRVTPYPTCLSKDKHEFLEWEKPNALDASELNYLQCASEHFGSPQKSVSGVVERLHQQLVAATERIKLIVQLRYEIFYATGKARSNGADTSCAQRSAYFQRIIAEQLEIVRVVDQALDACKKETSEFEHLCQRQLDVVNESELAWQRYLDKSPLWLDLLSFLPPIRQRRNARDRVFLLSSALTSALKHRDDGVQNAFDLRRTDAKKTCASALAKLLPHKKALEIQRASAINQKRDAEQAQDKITALLHRWQTSLANGCESIMDVSLDALNDHLDTLLRAPLFSLADWYWSGQWLVQIRARLTASETDSKGRVKLEAMYRRFAKLSPCLVSNFHVAPKFFTAWQGESFPLWNAIDLLIVDEAGQVSPEVGAGLFALAKRALVVGDTHQIEPVWGITETIDRANAVKFGLSPENHHPNYDLLEQGKYTAARGNLMSMANRACTVQKYPDLRGLMLTEHRRCVPELIRYCNDLIYAGRLEPKRASIPTNERIFPAFGTHDVQAEDQQVGTSRKNPSEARAIVDWLKTHRALIEAHYRDSIGKIVGVISPFKSQANQINSMLRKEMPDLEGATGLTVGTVHALQGAERAIVIFSATYGQGHKGGMFFDQTPNMLNVAVSRAKDTFLVFGNMALFNATKRTPSGLLARFMFD